MIPSEIGAINKSTKNANPLGVDSITAGILKSGDEYLSVRLNDLTNICAEKAEVPNDRMRDMFV